MQRGGCLRRTRSLYVTCSCGSAVHFWLFMSERLHMPAACENASSRTGTIAALQQFGSSSSNIARQQG